MQAYEESLTERERQYLVQLLDRDAQGWNKALKGVVWIALIIIAIVCIVTSLAEPADELEEQFSLLRFLIAAVAALLLLITIAVAAKKRFSSKFRADLKHGLKRVIPLQIQRKQFVQMSQTFHFFVNYPGLPSIEVSQADFLSFQVGDIIHVELAKYSETYLGYF